MIWDKLCRDHVDPNWEHYNKVDFFFPRGSKPLKKASKALKRYYFEGLTNPQWPLKQIPLKQKFLRPLWFLKLKFQEPTWPSKQMFLVVEGREWGHGTCKSRDIQSTNRLWVTSSTWMTQSNRPIGRSVQTRTQPRC